MLLKETHNCVTPKNHRLINGCLMKILKITVTKKPIVRFNNLGEENF